MWSHLKDLTVIYAVLTPTAVLYWRSTDVLLDRWLYTNTRKIAVGFVCSFILTCLHNVFRNNAPTTWTIRHIFETVYDYVITLSGLSYAIGCRVIYEYLVKSQLTPLHIAALAGLVLILFGGFRNVMVLPFVVHNDNALDRYRPLPTLVFIKKGRRHKFTFSSL